jgi:arylsulfatase
MPNVLYVVWDDASIAAWDAFGGLIETPNMKRLAARGLRYSQWHTPARSALTRSCLLTGRDSQPGEMARAGRGTGTWREQSVVIPPAAGTLAEILAESGYRTYCVGKWHLGQSEASSMLDSRRTWPLGRGFDRYYGFLGSQTSPWYPDLVYDNQYVDPPYPPAEGYHLSRDLADMAVEFIREGAQTAPGQAWLCYLSFGANDAPQIAPRDWTDKYRDRFEMGYDRYREIVLGRMKRLGMVPDNTVLAPGEQCRIGDAVAGADVLPPWPADHQLAAGDDRRSRRPARSVPSRGRSCADNPRLRCHRPAAARQGPRAGSYGWCEHALHVHGTGRAERAADPAV